MNRSICLCTLLLLVGAGGTAWPASDFVHELAADATSSWSEQRIYSKWHGDRPAVGGLGFEVVLGDWPRLLQRSFLDVLNSHNGNREVYRVAGWMDPGQIRTSQGPAQPKLAGESWCSRQYTLGSGREAMRMYVSRLTPAILLETGAPTLDLFAGRKWVGEGVTREQGQTTLVPPWIAYTADGQARVARTAEAPSLSDMDEPWVLLWYGQEATFYRTSVPNIIFKMQPLKDYMRDGYFIPADLPLLVVFQRRPRELQRTDDALRFTFDAAGTRAIALVPPLGFYHPPVSTTAAWARGLPEDIVKRCRTWARRLGAFPLTCAESRQISDDGGTVTIRQRFTYLDIADDWDTPAERLAPIPPVAAMAERYGFPVKVSGDAAPLAIPTHSGPYTGVAGSDTVEVTISGLDRYINEEPATPVPTSPEAQLLVEELRDEVRGMVQAGRLAPAMCIAPKSIHRMRFLFANPGEPLLALAEAMPYLDEAGKRAATAYALDTIGWRHPLTAHTIPNYEGARREYFEPATPGQFVEVAGRDGARMESTWIPERDRANNLYALWALARASGQWDLVRGMWDEAKSMAISARDHAEWATCGFVYQSGEMRNVPAAVRKEELGSVQSTNGLFARWVALARLADRFGDHETRDWATYMLARTALVRFAQGKVIRYMYDERFQTIETDPDWMFRLSTASGNGGGQGLLWTEHWAGAEDDARQVVRWDEFGPIIAQMFGDNWNPVLPTFQDLTPECGRFLAEHLPEEHRRFADVVEENCPAWFITRRIANVGKEKFMDYPQNSYGIFLGKCYVLGADGTEMLRCQDIPFTKVGDVYHLRRLAANLRCFGGLKWQPIEEGAP